MEGTPFEVPANYASAAEGYVDLPAIIISLLVMAVLIAGIKLSSVVNQIVVAIKLLVEYLEGIHVISFHISKWVSFGLIVVIFTVAYFYARKKGPVEEKDEDEATAFLEKHSN